MTVTVEYKNFLAHDNEEYQHVEDEIEPFPDFDCIYNFIILNKNDIYPINDPAPRNEGFTGYQPSVQFMMDERRADWTDRESRMKEL